MRINKHKRVLNSTAAGVTTIASALIDTAGYDRVKIIAAYGDISPSGQVVSKLQMGNASDGSDLADVKGSAITLVDGGDENKVSVHDVIRPQMRYMKHVSVRTGGNVIIDSVIAELGEGHLQPEAIDSTIKAYKQMGSPDLGTA